MQVTRVRSRMSGDMMTLFLLALAIFSAAPRHVACGRVLKQSAYTSVNGTDPGGPTDSYSPDGIAEASTGSQAIGVYYREGKRTVASDLLPAGFSFGYAGEGPKGPTYSVASLTKTDMSQAFGQYAIAMTEQGARAASGSSASYTLADGVVALSNNRESFRPGNSYGDISKSVALTDKPPNSVALVESGFGPTAIATGLEIASTARSRHEAPSDSIVTIGHRTAADKPELWLPPRRFLKQHGFHHAT